MQNILCLIYCTAHPQRQGLLASSLGAQRQSANRRVGGQHIFVKGLNLTANHSLASAYDICGEDTQLINIIQRRRPDISVFVIHRLCLGSVFSDHEHLKHRLDTVYGNLSPTPTFTPPVRRC